jgi:hypothetical protein
MTLGRMPATSRHDTDLKADFTPGDLALERVLPGINLLLSDC